MAVHNNGNYGYLYDEHNLKLHRTYFQEMVRLIGIYVISTNVGSTSNIIWGVTFPLSGDNADSRTKTGFLLKLLYNF